MGKNRKPSPSKSDENVQHLTKGKGTSKPKDFMFKKSKNNKSLKKFRMKLERGKKKENSFKTDQDALEVTESKPTTESAKTDNGQAKSKKEKKELKKASERANNAEGKPSEVKQDEPQNPSLKRRKEITRMKLEAKRLKKGLVMLSPKAESKIYKLKKALHKKGLPEEEIKQIIRQKRRTEELNLRKEQGCDIKSKNEHQTVCFRCRKPGHRVAECELVVEDNDQGVGVCFRCGSTEHILKNCSSKFTKGNLPFAKCFVCGKQGHLSNECPSNPKGTFPQGGKCNYCCSVSHLMKDCPGLVDSIEEDFTTGTLKAGMSADALD